jgi:hypothetical protein
MRKFVLVAAMVLVSATAQAGGSRGLTVASGDEPAAAEQPKAIEAPKSVGTSKPAEAPNYVARPAAVDTTTEAPKVDQAKSGLKRNSQSFRAERSRHRRPSIQARIIYALHRHGIYW